MAYWVNGYRTINGKRRKVRKLMRNGKIAQVRLFNNNHYTDRTAKKKGIYHVPGRVNYPNKAKRTDYYR